MVALITYRNIASDLQKASLVICQLTGGMSGCHLLCRLVVVCSSAVFLTSTVTIGIGVRGGILDDINHLTHHARVYNLHQR